MKLDEEKRFELLKLEMSLLQSTLDKYDDLIYRNRNWFITLWAALVGLSFTNKITFLPLFDLIDHYQEQSQVQKPIYPILNHL